MVTVVEQGNSLCRKLALHDIAIKWSSRGKVTEKKSEERDGDEHRYHPHEPADYKGEHAGDTIRSCFASASRRTTGQGRMERRGARLLCDRRKLHAREEFCLTEELLGRMDFKPGD